ncbi:MAG: DNA pilot protein [Microviridae sp.]|nr:MAG: DNA pilot protein [Microviridae sp.]
MPFPYAALAEGIVNTGSAALTNSANSRYATMQYNIERKDALADWERVNNYNKPSAQMQRYKEAGLNPNLIYGQGNEGQAIHSPQTKNVNFKAPEPIGAATVQELQQMYNKPLQSAQISNTEAATALQIEQANLARANKLNVDVDTQLKATNQKSLDFDLGLKSELKQTSIDAARLGTQKQAQDLRLNLADYELRALQNSSNLKEANERILDMRLGRAKTSQEIQNLKAVRATLSNQATLQKLEIALKNKGITWSDPLIARAIGQALGTGVTPQNVVPRILNSINTPQNQRTHKKIINHLNPFK